MKFRISKENHYLHIEGYFFDDWPSTTFEITIEKSRHKPYLYDVRVGHNRGNEGVLQGIAKKLRHNNDVIEDSIGVGTWQTWEFQASKYQLKYELPIIIKGCIKAYSHRYEEFKEMSKENIEKLIEEICKE